MSGMHSLEQELISPNVPNLIRKVHFSRIWSLLFLQKYRKWHLYCIPKIVIPVTAQPS